MVKIIFAWIAALSPAIVLVALGLYTKPYQTIEVLFYLAFFGVWFAIFAWGVWVLVFRYT